MKGYLTTCDGAQFELPTLLKWEFSYTGSVPCDSFTLKCAYEPAMAEVLRRAVRFTAREDGAVAEVSAAADAAAVSAAVAAAVSAAAEAVRAAAVQEGDKLFSDFCRINFII